VAGVRHAGGSIDAAALHDALEIGRPELAG